MSEQLKNEGMLCPICNVGLVMSERHGIEIDYCPKCRGVWLDRGELDKIIEHAASLERANPAILPQPATKQAPPAAPSPWLAPNQYYQNHQREYEYKAQGQKRRSWLSDLFD